MTIYQRILFSTLTVLTLTIGILTYTSTRQLSQELHVLMDKSLLSQGSATAHGISDWLKSKQALIDNNASHIRRTSMDTDTMVSTLKMVKEAGGFSVAYYGTADGDMYRNLGLNTVKNYDPRIRPWYKEASRKGRLITIGPYVGKADGKLVIFIATPVGRDGVTGVNLPLAKVTDDVVSVQLAGKGYAFLISENGDFLAHPKREYISTPIDEYTRDLSLIDIERYSGNVFTRTVNGHPYLVTSLPVEGTTWHLVLMGDEEILNDEVSALVINHAIIAVVLLVIIGGVISGVLRYSIKHLLGVSAALKDIASGGGDLTVSIDIKSNDEVGMLAKDFNLFVRKMRGIIVSVDQGAKKLMRYSDESAVSSEKLTDQVSRSRQEATMVATAVSQMSVATAEIARNAETTAASAKSAVEASLKGRDYSHKSNESIKRLAEKVSEASGIISELEGQSGRVNQIVSSISDIAEQTNLLALNAAIEAARAGEFGRGFAVVADQVRELSNGTHQSTEEASKVISTLQNTVGSVVVAMRECQSLAEKSVEDNDFATTSFDAICEEVNHISDMTTQISTAAEEQTCVSEEIAKNTEQIRVISESLDEEAQASKEKSQHLKNSADELSAEVSKFKID